MKILSRFILVASFIASLYLLPQMGFDALLQIYKVILVNAGISALSSLIGCLSGVLVSTVVPDPTRQAKTIFQRHNNEYFAPFQASWFVAGTTLSAVACSALALWNGVSAVSSEESSQLISPLVSYFIGGSFVLQFFGITVAPLMFQAY